MLTRPNPSFDPRGDAWQGTDRGRGLPRHAPATLLSTALLLLGAVALQPLFRGDADAHGAVYRAPQPPPGWSPPPPPGGTKSKWVPPAAAPTTGAPADLADWTLWWGFQRDRLLDLKASIHRASASTGSEEFFLGQGESTLKPKILAPDRATVQGELVPTLLGLLRKGNLHPDIHTSTLIALAKIGGGDAEGDRRIAEAFVPSLANTNQEISETAALALGILGHSSSCFLLGDLVLDADAARSAVGRHQVPDRTRTFAAYGLGLLGDRTDRSDLKKFVVSRLTSAFERNDSSSYDLRVACAVSMGLVPLAVAEKAASPDRPPRPSASRQEQLRWALLHFTDAALEPGIRGHFPVSMARLCEGLELDLRAPVIDALLEPIAVRAKTPRDLRVGIISALGLLGDSDADPHDQRIRAALEEGALGGQLPEKNLAWMSLARNASRRGVGPEPLTGLEHGRVFLTGRLAKAKATQRPWAALALATLERNEAEALRLPSTEVRRALRLALDEASSPVEVGGLGLAAGLVGDHDARSILADKLHAQRDDEARGQLALALGFLGARDMIETLEEMVEGSRYRPGLLRDSAIALGLLGDKDLVPKLVEMLENAKALSSQASIAAALGFIGDRRSIDPLLGMLANEELSDQARAFAVVALGIVADRNSLPWNTRLAEDVNYAVAPPTLTNGQASGILDIL